MMTTNWADDLIAIADAVGFDEFGLTGWSEGGAWALTAVARIDPARLRHVSSVAPGSYGAFGDNSAAEYLSELLYRAWAFDVSGIERPVHTWQGTDDRLVPEPINEMVADRMPGSVWPSVAGAGHFAAVGAGDDIFAVAAEELGAP